MARNFSHPTTITSLPTTVIQCLAVALEEHKSNLFSYCFIDRVIESIQYTVQLALLIQGSNNSRMEISE